MKAALLAAALVVLGVSVAYAEDVTASVVGIDTSGHRIGLDNGKVYAVLPSIPLAPFLPGEKVTVTFTADDSGAAGVAGTATAIKAAK